VVVTAAAIAVLRLGDTPEAIEGPARSLAVAMAVAAGIVVIFLPGIALVALLGDRLAGPLRPPALVLGAALAGWAFFLLFWLGSIPGAIGIAVVFTASVARLTRGRYRPDCETTDAVIVMGLIVFFFVAVAGDHGGLVRGPDMIAHRYWVSVDNSLPRLFADQFLQGGARPELLTGWLTSDRPPLQAGMVLPAYALSTAAARPFAYLVLSVVANVAWVPCLWGFLLAAGARRRHVAAITAALAFAGPIFVNTVYTWPKMLGGALILAAAAALLERTTSNRDALLFAGVAASLAMLAHGGAVAGVLALLPVAVPWRRGRRPVVLAAFVAAACYAPWLGYQKWVAPPGDRLVKWHLAGVDIGTPDDRSATEAIMDQYRRAGWAAIGYKVTNARVILGDPTAWHGERMQRATPAWSGSSLGRLRQLALARVGPIPGVFLVGLIPFASRRIRRRQPVRTAAKIVVATAVAYAIIEWGGVLEAAAWLHTSPYSLVLLWPALLALAVAEWSERALLAILAVHAVSFFALWVAGVTLASASGEPAAAPLDLQMMAAAAAAAGLIGFVTITRLRSPLNA
jgi:hypothetical protein